MRLATWCRNEQKEGAGVEECKAGVKRASVAMFRRYLFRFSVLLALTQPSDAGALRKQNGHAITAARNRDDRAQRSPKWQSHMEFRAPATLRDQERCPPSGILPNFGWLLSVRACRPLERIDGQGDDRWH